MKRVVLYANTVSPHQLPLANELICMVGAGNLKYVYTQKAGDDYAKLGWSAEVPEWCGHVDSVDASEWLETADVLLSGLRCFDLFERRAKKGLKNFYMTERWLKPPVGLLRLLHPRYFGYARQLCRLMDSGSVVGLPIGIHAARDMARLCGLVHGNVSCLFKAPQLDFESKPGGKVWLKDEPRNTRSTRQYCLDKMRMWGYFVESSKLISQSAQVENADDNSKLQTQNSKLKTLRVLWVGRLLKLKRVDTIIRAVGELSNSNSNPYPQLSLDIYGAGPEEAKLKKLAANFGDCINFYPPVPIDDVRKLMHEHDIYILASNGYEGWGAVVSEALEEGMKVVGTYEAGSSATILPKECLFHAGVWKVLLKLLSGNIPSVGIRDWSARRAMEVIDA